MGTLLDFALNGLGLMKPGLGKSVIFLDKAFFTFTVYPSSLKYINGYQLGVTL